MGNYDDIIKMKRPDSGRAKMDILDRAKIFMPFAALKGYEESIDDINNITDKIEELYTVREEVQEF
ncbi:MAG: hypothetical protein E7270_09660 [Lachnospiraceae bacterium]|nr:hypothetical protein [Lachnospiraceae bacterium]MBQ4068582.1 hypothetical protein [Lachnospiraceae bacterium]